MLRPQKLAKGPLKAFKGKGGKCGIYTFVLAIPSALIEVLIQGSLSVTCYHHCNAVLIKSLLRELFSQVIFFNI